RMVVGAQEREMRIVEPRLVQVEHTRADPEARPLAAARQADVRPAGVLLRVRVADVGKRRGLEAAAPLEGAEVLARLRHLPARQREEGGEGTPRAVGVGQVLRLDLLRLAVRTVALAEERRLGAQDAVRVGRGAPEDRARGHRAFHHPVHLVEMAGPAGRPRDAQVAGVDEADPLGRLLEGERVRALRVRRARPAVAGGPALREARSHVRLDARRLDLRALRSRTLRAPDPGIAAMAIDARELHGGARVHGLDSRMAGKAARAPGLRPLSRLAEEIDTLSGPSGRPARDLG